jgi:hypothetical protein
VVRKRGCQYRLQESGFTTRPGSSGIQQLVLSTLVTHLGKSGDPALQVANLEVRFADGAGTPLTAAQVAARVRSLSAYVDSNANGAWDGADALLVTESRMDQAAGGKINLPLTLAAPVLAGPSGTVTLFTVTVLSASCGTGVRPSVRATGQTAVDALAGGHLLSEGMSTLTGETVVEIDPASYLRINEIAANLVVDGNVVDDWIEIYNSGPYPVDLTGMYLTDDLTKPRLGALPTGLVLKPWSHIVFIADDTSGHLPFKLSSGGEEVGLFDSDARRNRLLDSVSYPAQAQNQSSGRLPDGANNWRALAEPTKGIPNGLAGAHERFYLPVIIKGFGC